MSEPGTTTPCTNTSKYMELGWGERGDRLLPNGNPERFVYAFDTYTCSWQFASVQLDAGEMLELAMTPTSDAGCVPGSGNCEWAMQYKREGQTTWTTFTTITMNVGNDLAPDIGTEVQNKAGGLHWEIAGADAGDTVDFEDVAFYHSSDGLWYYWTPTELPGSFFSTPVTAPYAIDYGTQFRRFWTRRT